MDKIDLDARSAQDFFNDAVNLAKQYCTHWRLPASWPSDSAPNANDIGADPGLALLKLFSFLIGYLADVENGIPFRWQAAFYRFLDASLRTAAPAFAPIQFTLAGGQPSKTVPGGSAVHDTATQTIRFETDEDLRVVPARIDSVLTMASALDGFIDCLSGWPTQAAPIFVSAPVASDGQADAKPLPHWLLLGDSTLFEYDPAVKRMEITLSGWHLSTKYFQDWCDGRLVPFDTVRVQSSESRCRLSVFIDDPFKSPARGAVPMESVAQLNGTLVAEAGFAATAPGDALDPQAAVALHWLLAKPADGVRVYPGADTLPAIRAVHCTLRGHGALPWQTALNDSPLDLTNGGYPFGKTPAREDAFYIRHDKAFAYPGGAIALDFALAESPHVSGVTLDWQFWSGSRSEWISFLHGGNRYGFDDGTSHLSKSGSVRFTCPDVGPQTVAGQIGYWIRAVLTAFDAANGYGFQPLAPAIDQIPVQYLPPQYKWPLINYLVQDKKVTFLSRYQNAQAAKGPFVTSLKIDFTITAAVSSTWRHNAFQLDRLALSEGRAHPYQPLPDMPTTLYIGFDCDDVAGNWVGERVSLYVEVENERAGAGPALRWEWLDARAQRWRALEVEDHTAKLARSATVRFTVPDAMREAVCFSREACWLRVSGTAQIDPVRVTGIYINTTGSFNVRTFSDVILGSSNGLPNQKFSLPFAGVHELKGGESLEARNVGAQSDVQLQVLEPPALEGNLQPEQADTPVKVDWTYVDSFVGAGPKCRVFTVEGRSGIVTFGNGVQGMIPPAGAQNIIVARYRTTDGKKANVPAGSLGLFAAGIPGIARVINPTDARGGVDGENVSDLVRDAPTRVRANGHAVTLDDLESLAEQASARVCRAVAISKTGSDGIRWPAPSRYIELVVLAKSDEPRARTAPSILDDVYSYVMARSPMQMHARIEVKSAKFKPIDVYAVIKTNAPAYQWDGLKAMVSAQILTFLHPVHGGSASDGWPFGAAVASMDISTLLAGLKTIVSVDVVTLCGNPFQVMLEADQVPTPGAIALTLEAA